MAYTFSYDLTEDEKRAVRALLAQGLAKYRVSCCVEASQLKESMGEPTMTTDRLAEIMESLGERRVEENRSGAHGMFPIFEAILAQGAYPESARWTYKFSKEFLQFRVGREL